METFFMNSKNSKTSEPNRFEYDLIDKLDLKNPNKLITQLITIISLKYQHQLGMRLLIYLMDLIIYQKYKIILNI